MRPRFLSETKTQESRLGSNRKKRSKREVERAASRQASEERKKELHKYAVAIAERKLALAGKRLNADKTAQKAFDDLVKRAFPQ